MPDRFLHRSSGLLSVAALTAVALLASAALASAPAANGLTVDDWPDWRGPYRDGTSPLTDLPEGWSLDGDNLAWTAPYGGRSTPVIFGDRLYTLTRAGDEVDRQERLVALNADTGELIWEHRFNVTQSDAPPRRVGWASPVVDPVTGNVFAFGVDGQLASLSPAGEVLWSRQLSEMFGTISTHGGRTPSPVLVGGNVVVSGVASGWGDMARGMHRLFAFDMETGQVAWVGSTGNPPHDTTYAPPLVSRLAGRQLLILGGGDGAAHAFQATTGTPVWRYGISKRGINTGILILGDRAIVTHGEENLEDSTMGLIAAVDATAEGELDADDVMWDVPGHLGGYSSPVSDGELVYQVDNGSNLVAFDAATGERLWTYELGTIQKASPVYADGKLYVGSQNGTVYILRPSRDGVEELSAVDLTSDDGDTLEEIIASPAVARGRVYQVSHDRIYAIGPAEPQLTGEPIERPGMPTSDGPVAQVQIFPQELVLAPGETRAFQARLFDADGAYVRTVTDGATWSVSGIAGSMSADGSLEVAADAPAAGGRITATVDGIEGSARLRVIPPLPWSWDFDSMENIPAYWVSALGKFRLETEDDGNGVLVKNNENPFLKRTKVYMGPNDLHDYTMQVDFRSDFTRRRMGDAGLTAQRYSLIMFGAKQQLMIVSWHAELERAASAQYDFEPDIWYRMKMRTENLPDGRVAVRGKLWPRDEPEPEDWTIEQIDELGERHGSPGLYADAHALVTFDNLEVMSNR